jgi:putative Holliday junction resolvase
VLQPFRVTSETLRPEPGALRPGTRLAVDVGSARIGIARCDPAGILATPLCTVRRGTGDLTQIARLAAEHDAIEIVVGLPTGLSGRQGRAAAGARAFASALAPVVAPVRVRLVDERFTTVIAHAALRESGKTGAAALLLQSALDAERSTGDPAGELVGSLQGGGR